MYQFLRAVALALLFPFVRRRVLGQEHLPRAGAFVLAANHISHFDPPLLGVTVPRTVAWMATAEFYEHRVLGPILRAVGAFPIDRASPKGDSRAAREAGRRLKRGEVVGLFPEGGLRAGVTSVLEGAPLRAGAQRLAAIARAPLIPCVILGSDRLYRPRWRNTVWIGFGAPLRPGEALGDRLRMLGGEMQRAFALSPDDLPMTPQRRKGRE